MQTSHPTRVRGLKLSSEQYGPDRTYVAPYTGAWIEIFYNDRSDHSWIVAPYTGAWIEIIMD